MAVLMAGVAQAAVINWGTVQDISGDADVSLNGTNQWAYSFGSADVTLNTQLFTGESASTGNADVITTYDKIHGTAFGAGVAPFTGLSSGYQTLLESAAYSSFDVTVTMNDLLIGQDYEVQFWVNDSRGGKYATRGLSVDGVGLAYNVTEATGGVGQYVIGTFKADTETQSMLLDSSTNQLNAIQLRAIPEPATIGLIAAFGGGLLIIRRRFMI
ncbi:PEP-CTERM sorting domain-containing protein [Pontiellaceae bacterium B12219]|nr:PEP-CTERM sorting domain-containing protein [Pontiellaceae bacterium B12219]